MKDYMRKSNDYSNMLLFLLFSIIQLELCNCLTEIWQMQDRSFLFFIY